MNSEHSTRGSTHRGSQRSEPVSGLATARRAQPDEQKPPEVAALVASMWRG